MKRLLPSRMELAVFSVLAVVFATIVSLGQAAQHDLWLAGLAAPLFIFAAVLGLRRSPQWQVSAEQVAIAVEVDQTAADRA